jgi:hypothetical protein
MFCERFGTPSNVFWVGLGTGPKMFWFGFGTGEKMEGVIGLVFVLEFVGVEPTLASLVAAVECWGLEVGLVCGWFIGFAGAFAPATVAGLGCACGLGAGLWCACGFGAGALGAG